MLVGRDTRLHGDSTNFYGFCGSDKKSIGFQVDFYATNNRVQRKDAFLADASKDLECEGISYSYTARLS